MLCKRIIACLDVVNGKVVKGTKFRDHKILGDSIELAQRYRDQGVDELVFYDITASCENRRVHEFWIDSMARFLDIPFCVAGGIRSRDDARLILNAGADKISINSPALENPGLISELVQEFGQQCVVVGIDSRRVHNTFMVYSHTGSELTTKNTAKSTVEWAKEVQTLGAGEIVLNCMDSDGMGKGYDIEQLIAVRQQTTIPLIASGGAKTAMDFVRAFREAKVDGCLAAGAFHRNELCIPDLKAFLIKEDIGVRI